ncbi:podocalyxin-like protein 2 [Protopterus annectens]|uniref:podocalyxin-like protein 2 n=1 Tax=Protopterus annectens TaxID=7888 RepID=UPI001CFC3CD9|nr:podocalyxin-like protein 2 [Protopterus annectens]
MVNTILDVKLFMRKLNLQHILGSDSMAPCLMLKKSSTYNPPLHPQISNLENRIVHTIRSQVGRFNNHSNLTQAENALLTELCCDTSVRIMQPDKGGGTVIMEQMIYEAKMHDILNDTTKYTIVSLNEVHMSYKKIDMVIKDLLDQEVIEQDLYTFLSNLHPKVPTIFGVPKIHKNAMDPPLRPIVAAQGSKTHNLSKYLDWKLKQLWGKQQHLLKDSWEFLRGITSDLYRSDLLFVTIDVVDLFSVIPSTIGLAWMEEALWACAGVTNNDVVLVMHLLELVLKYNYVYFGGEYFQQISGVSMGANCAPTYADMILSVWENKFVLQSSLHCLLTASEELSERTLPPVPVVDVTSVPPYVESLDLTDQGMLQASQESGFFSNDNEENKLLQPPYLWEDGNEMNMTNLDLALSLDYVYSTSGPLPVVYLTQPAKEVRTTTTSWLQTSPAPSSALQEDQMDSGSNQTKPTKSSLPDAVMFFPSSEPKQQHEKAFTVFISPTDDWSDFERGSDQPTSRDSEHSFSEKEHQTSVLKEEESDDFGSGMDSVFSKLFTTLTVAGHGARKTTEQTSLTTSVTLGINKMKSSTTDDVPLHTQSSGLIDEDTDATESSLMPWPQGLPTIYWKATALVTQIPYQNAQHETTSTAVVNHYVPGVAEPSKNEIMIEGHQGFAQVICLDWSRLTGKSYVILNISENVDCELFRQQNGIRLLTLIENAFSKARERLQGSWTVSLSKPSEQDKHFLMTLADEHGMIPTKEVIEALQEAKLGLKEIGIQNVTSSSNCQSRSNPSRSDYGKLFIVLVIIGSICVIIIISGLIYICWQRRLPKLKNMSHSEELHFVENGCHDNPTLDVTIDSQSEMQEKKPSVNGDAMDGSDSWSILINKRVNDEADILEEDTHL